MTEKTKQHQVKQGQKRKWSVHIGEDREGEHLFVQKGCCVDEVTLRFDDGQELYVSVGFLTYASPVFKAMLTNDFAEKKSKVAILAGKRYDSMLMFLKCLLPGIVLEITASNVAIIAPLAEEYQVDKIIAKCKEVMTIWLRRGYDFQEKHLLVKVPDRHPHSPESHASNSISAYAYDNYIQQTVHAVKRFPKDVNVCLKVLRIALSLNYSRICSEAVSILSNIPFKYTSGESTVPAQDAAVVSENQKLFETLPQKLQLVICQRRLKVSDK